MVKITKITNLKKMVTQINSYLLENKKPVETIAYYDLESDRNLTSEE